VAGGKPAWETGLQVRRGEGISDQWPAGTPERRLVLPMQLEHANNHLLNTASNAPEGRWLLGYEPAPLAI
jgi:hypothetical protein